MWITTTTQKKQLDLWNKDSSGLVKIRNNKQTKDLDIQRNASFRTGEKNILK